MKEVLSLFDALRPPPGYETDAALGTTYSADLVACMVALTNLDGAAVETERFNRVAAIRALKRHSGHVRIAFQQGRIGWNAKPQPLLALLDRVLRPVPFDGNERSFHPKVWITRQLSDEGEQRWVLVVGSRNLTSNIAWDLGLTLVGSSSQRKTGRWKRLPGLQRLVARTCELMGEPGFGRSFSALDDVLWHLPEGCNDVALHFSPGQTSESLPASPPIELIHRADRVLFVSPFLDATMIKAVAKASDAEVRLVAGGPDLEKVAAGSARDALMGLCPHSFQVANPDEVVESTPTALEERGDRGLHAKLTLVRCGHRHRLLVGSHNLTRRAWGGANCEASMELAIAPELADSIWEWSGEHGVQFRPSEAPAKNSAREVLDELRNQLAVVPIELVETEPERAELISETPLLVAGSAARLEIARLSRPERVAAWSPGGLRAAMPSAEPSERTALLVFRASFEGETCAWVQQVRVTPELGDDRDRELLVRILGPGGFLQYLNSLIGDGSALDGDDEESSLGSSHASGANSRARESPTEFRFEALLRHLCRADPDGSLKKSFEEATRAVMEHRALLEKTVTSTAERERLRHLWLLWDAISEGMRAA